MISKLSCGSKRSPLGYSSGLYRKVVDIIGKGYINYIFPTIIVIRAGKDKFRDITSVLNLVVRITPGQKVVVFGVNARYERLKLVRQIFQAIVWTRM